jgi:hypothetical protein
MTRIYKFKWFLLNFLIRVNQWLSVLSVVRFGVLCKLRGDIRMHEHRRGFNSAKCDADYICPGGLP